MRTLLPTLLVCTVLHIGMPAGAQNLFDFGLKGGVNMDDLKTGYQHESVIGGNVGVFARVKPPILPGVQGELLLTSLGTNVTVEGYNADLRTVAMQVPVFMVLALGPAELHAGGYYEHYLTKNFVDDLDVVVEGQDVSVADLADDGYGLLLGGGVRFKHFYAGVRYNMGLDGVGSAPLLEDVQNRQIQAYVGFGLFKAD